MTLFFDRPAPPCPRSRPAADSAYAEPKAIAAAVARPAYASHPVIMSLKRSQWCHSDATSPLHAAAPKSFYLRKRVQRQSLISLSSSGS
jgi:hypothetical protein